MERSVFFSPGPQRTNLSLQTGLRSNGGFGSKEIAIFRQRMIIRVNTGQEEKVSLVEKNEELEDSIKEKIASLPLYKIKSKYHTTKLPNLVSNNQTQHLTTHQYSYHHNHAHCLAFFIDNSAFSPTPTKPSPLDTNTLNTQSSSPSSHHCKNCENSVKTAK